MPEQVFISWSGARSDIAARALRELIGTVAPEMATFLSSQTIAPGAQGVEEIVRALKSGLGIFCVTHDNMNAPWIHFELGAIFKANRKNRACPVLIDIELADLPPNSPLRLFQVRAATRDGVREILTRFGKVAWAEAHDERMEEAWPRYLASEPKLDELLEGYGNVMLASNIDTMCRAIRVAELTARRLGDKEETLWRAKRRMLASVPTADAVAEIPALHAQITPYLQSVQRRMQEMPEYREYFGTRMSVP